MWEPGVPTALMPTQLSPLPGKLVERFIHHLFLPGATGEYCQSRHRNKEKKAVSKSARALKRLLKECFYFSYS